MSSARLLAFFSCPHLSLPLCWTVCECYSLDHVSRFHVLTRSSTCSRQDVGAPRALAFFPCANMSLPLSLTVCEFRFCTHFVFVVTCASHFAQQAVSMSLLLSFLPCSDLSLTLCSTDCTCPFLPHCCPFSEISVPLHSTVC